MSARPLLIFALAVGALLAPGAAGDAWARPPAPIGLEVRDGEESWHDSNRFYLSWQLPDTGYSLPIVATDYLIRGPAGNVVAQMRWDGPLERTDFFLHDGPGRYTVEVWLEDMVGAGPHAEASLRYDESRPGFATAAPVDGWIGRTDFPYSVRIEHPQGPPPPSGIRGLRDLDRQVPRRTAVRGPDSLYRDRDRPSRRDRRRLDPYPRTSRGAEPRPRRRGLRVGNVIGRGRDTVLRVDRTDPVTRIDGGAGEWANRGVTITITATDSGSGMAGDGAFTAVQIDSGRPSVASGDSVTATVIGAGVHRIAHYASDAAGNVNDGATHNGVRDRPPAVSTIGIDRDPPTVAFADSQDPSDPELIRALVAFPLAAPSAARGSIAVRAAGSGDRFQPLATAVLAGELRARWDSEAYPPGRYEFRATGYDAAGNATASEHRLDGAPMLLANPLKTPIALSIGFGGETLVWQHCTRERGGRRCRREEVSGLASRPRVRVVPYGRGTLVSGRLTTGGGGAPGRRPGPSPRAPRAWLREHIADRDRHDRP